MPTGLAPRIPALRGRFPAVRRRHHGKRGGEFFILVIPPTPVAGGKTM